MQFVFTVQMLLIGFHEVLVRWVGSFLTGRSQRVSVGNTISPAVTPPGGIPQGTKLAPLLCAVLVNNLARQWNLRAKYVDDLTIAEVIPKTSVSMLTIIANSISTRKVLGVYITSDLTWGHHCDYIVKRAGKRLYALRVLKNRTARSRYYSSLL